VCMEGMDVELGAGCSRVAGLLALMSRWCEA
jgi:hypothetical protein